MLSIVGRSEPVLAIFSYRCCEQNRQPRGKNSTIAQIVENPGAKSIEQNGRQLEKYREDATNPTILQNFADQF